MSDGGIPLEKIDDYRWRIPQSYTQGMRVPGIIYADRKLLADIVNDRSLEQVANVAFLPGIVKASFAMPDIHWGYGFPIGGVAATDVEAGGVISPGGVGFDINCGVRLVRTNLRYEEIKEKLSELVDKLFNGIPTGVGKEGEIRVSAKEERDILVEGAGWAVKKGYGTPEDLERIEEHGCMAGAKPEEVSYHAKDRQRDEMGTLGSGNHYLELQCVAEIFDAGVAAAFGLHVGDVVISAAPTALIRHAERYGCKWVNGRDMHSGQVDALTAFFASASHHLARGESNGARTR
jgi:tRNA-splicing ligase RtcB